jgi:predicted permease
VLGQVDTRSAEFAVRAALGASRRRLLQQLAVEVLLVAAAAGALGAVLARAASAVVTCALPLGEWANAAAPDWRVFASAMTIAVAAALLVALAPAISLGRRDLRAGLSRARTGGIGEGGGRLEGSLVVAQVALAVTVAAGAALLARSVANLYAVDPGVRIEGMAVVDVLFDPGSRDRARVEQALDEVVTALAGLSGVQSVGAAQLLPLRDGGYRLEMISDEVPEPVGTAIEYRAVTPGYLESIGLPLRRGRTIDRADRGDTERVVVINAALARKYYAGVDPVGRLVRDENGTSRIVGVVGNAAETRLREPAPPVRYVPVAQASWLDAAQSLVLRLAPGVDERSVLEAARRTIATVAPDLAVRKTTTMREVQGAAIGPAREVVQLLSALTALALVLGAVGIYGATAHFSARRRRDWAVRVALGLPAARVVLHIVAHSALLVAAGISVGVAGAALLTRALSSFLYGVAAVDPVAFAAAGAALLGVGVAAAFLPALQAGMADPLVALREQ